MKQISKERKEELINMDYGDLQSTEEYRHYINTYIFSQSKLFNEVEWILNKSYEDTDAPYSWDDVENLNYYDFDRIETELTEEIEEKTTKELKELETTKKELLKELKELINNEDISDIENFAIDNLLNSNMDDYLENNEILQWFLMDERIISELTDRQQPTLSNTFWGRTCCGQSIELDGVIIDIFKKWYLNLYGIVDGS